MGRTAVVLRLASSGRKAWVHPLSFVGRALSTSTTESSSSDIVFPWRSSAVELQRLVEQDDLSGQSNSLRARFFRGALAGREMGLSWFQVLLWPTWQQELADDLVWAFQKGLSGLLSKTFRVPMETVDKGDDGIVLDTKEQHSSQEEEDDGVSSSSWTEEQEREAQAYVEKTLESSLSQMYDSIDWSSFRVRLAVQPVSWRLEHIFVVPVLSRDAVCRDPALKGAYRRIEETYQENRDLGEIRRLAEELVETTSNAEGRTLLADLSVLCNESFLVQHRTTGDVVQGEEEEEDDEERQEPIRQSRLATHLVRFEMDLQRGTSKAPQWQIIDWDDMLDGNVWY